MVVSIQIDASKAISGLESVERAITDAIQVTLDKCADSAIQGAQSIVPVVTGQLRDSIGVKEQGANYVVVAADTDYAAAIEFGTGARPAQPYLGPQADRLNTEGAKILIDELENRIG